MNATPSSGQARFESLEVKNSHASAPRVVLFGRMADGQVVARRLAEDEVPYTEAWPDAVEQVMVYIEPDDEQLQRIVAALQKGELEFSRLQDYGGLQGGVSIFSIGP